MTDIERQADQLLKDFKEEGFMFPEGFTPEIARHFAVYVATRLKEEGLNSAIYENLKWADRIEKNQKHRGTDLITKVFNSQKNRHKNRANFLNSVLNNTRKLRGAGKAPLPDLSNYVQLGRND